MSRVGGGFGGGFGRDDRDRFGSSSSSFGFGSHDRHSAFGHGGPSPMPTRDASGKPLKPEVPMEGQQRTRITARELDETAHL
jgi:hypothetical protein